VAQEWALLSQPAGSGSYSNSWVASPDLQGSPGRDDTFSTPDTAARHWWRLY
jgi:hypothetical protein